MFFLPFQGEGRDMHILIRLHELGFQIAQNPFQVSLCFIIFPKLIHSSVCMFVYIGIPDMTTSIFLFIKQEQIYSKKVIIFFLKS